MMRSYEFNLGVAYQAQRQARQAWDMMDVARRFGRTLGPREVVHRQQEARWAAQEARDEYALACGYPLD